jgi:hypothetical protein
MPAAQSRLGRALRKPVVGGMAVERRAGRPEVASLLAQATTTSRAEKCQDLEVRSGNFCSGSTPGTTLSAATKRTGFAARCPSCRAKLGQLKPSGGEDGRDRHPDSPPRSG